MRLTHAAETRVPDLVSDHRRRHWAASMPGFSRSRLGPALVGAVAIVVGIYIAAVLGITKGTTTTPYLIGAAAGFIGGWIGAIWRQRREGS
jgi:hypothetical protein